MSELNPYAAPEADVDRPYAPDAVHTVAGARRVPVGNSWQWIASGWQHFVRNPGIWIAAVLIWSAINIGLSMLPFVSVLSSLIAPIASAGFMIGCREQDNDRDFLLEHAFAGFSNRTAQLLTVGALYLAGLLVVMLVVGGLAAGIVISGVVGLENFGTEAASGADLLLIALFILVVLFLSLPLLMALWFAPPLVVLGELGAVDAMKLSFRGCLVNVLPFLVYGFIGLGLLIVAMLPLLLGLLIFGPVIVASGYAAYKDIFLEPAPAAGAPA